MLTEPTHRLTLYLIDRATQRPQRPSAFLGLPLSPGAALDFDLAFEEFTLWREGRERATIEVPAPEKPKQTVPHPKYQSLHDLLDLDGEEAAQAAEDQAAMEAETMDDVQQLKAGTLSDDAFLAALGLTDADLDGGGWRT